MRLCHWTLVLSILLTASSVTEQAPPDRAWHLRSVEVHNRFRRSVWPPAANMAELVWSPTLAKLAQKAADRCDGYHSRSPEYKGFGENTFGGGSEDPEDWAMLWFYERDYYNHSTGECQSGIECGHYSMFARDIAKEVGCGYQKCYPGSTWTTGYCLYNRGAQNPPYTIGSPCSKCENNLGDPNDQYSIRTSKCFNGLCVQEGYEAGRILTCDRKCENCGQLNPDTCKCDCKAGYHGDNCEKMKAAPTVPCPSQCQKLGLSCFNGGTIRSSTNECSCDCPSGFSGNLCQDDVKQMNAGITFKLRGRIYEKKGVVTDTQTFKTDILGKLAPALAAKVNGYCQANMEAFRECCPSVVQPAAVQPVLDPTNGVLTIDNFPRILDASGDLQVGLYTKIRLSNCRSTEGLPAYIFLAALKGLDWANTPGLKEYSATIVDNNVTKALNTPSSK